MGLKGQSIVIFKGQAPVLVLTSAETGKSAQNGIMSAAALGDFV